MTYGTHVTGRYSRSPSSLWLLVVFFSKAKNRPSVTSNFFTCGMAYRSLPVRNSCFPPTCPFDKLRAGSEHGRTIGNPKSETRPERMRRISFHWMTLFARASSSYGTVKPICFAALRLMMNSNFIACCTGRSAGFVPLRILST